jgi:hypothetical protein
MLSWTPGANCGDPFALLSAQRQQLCVLMPGVLLEEVTQMMTKMKKRETSCGALLFCALARPRKRPSVTRTGC